MKKREEPKLKNVWPVPTKPIVFCNVVGEEGDNKLWSPGRRKKVMLESKFNSKEAAKAVSTVQYSTDAKKKPKKVLFINFFF